MAAAKKTTSTKKASARKSTSSKSAPKKPTAKKTPAKENAPKKAPAKRTAAKRTTTKKAPVSKKVPVKKTTAKKPPVKKAAAKKATAKKAPVSKKVPVKKTTAKNSPANKTAAKKPPVKKSMPKKPKATTSSRATRPGSTNATPSLLSNATYDRVEVPKPRGKTKDGISYTKDFDVKFLKAQKAELNSRRDAELARATRLEDEATSLIENGEMGDVQFDDEGGEGDTMVVQRDLDRVLSSQSRQTIEEIDAALLRIKVGTYGFSEVSGLPIQRERLEAIPETTVLAAEKVSGAGPR
ncbi:MAG: histone H1-like repetitive region-containing protein [Ilumatobacteraceae bacterium]|nr:histone H1-like repetitive region-containing protein [Ilumatobacteraceae bacterium]